jgi:hypothetical protein
VADQVTTRGWFRRMAPDMAVLIDEEDGEGLWEWYQFDQRLNGWFAPSNLFLRLELMARAGWPL